MKRTVVVQLLSRVRLFATPGTAVRQSSLSFTISWSLLKFMSVESVMLSDHLILCHPLLLLPSVFPSIRVFSSESALHISGQSIGASASASVLSVNIRGRFPLGLTGLISPQSKGLSRVFSNTPAQNHQLFGTQLSLWSRSHMTTRKNTALTRWIFVGKVKGILALIKETPESSLAPSAV